MNRYKWGKAIRTGCFGILLGLLLLVGCGLLVYFVGIRPTQSAAPPPAAAAQAAVVPADSGQQAAAPPPAAQPAQAIVASGDEAHWQRLRQLDPTFRSSGFQAWLQAAGVVCDSVTADARQIEEETAPDGTILASGLQVQATNCVVPWPNIVTTDVPSRITVQANTRQYTPDQRNPSTLYTNVTANGPVTFWIDGSNWGQLVPTD